MGLSDMVDAVDTRSFTHIGNSVTEMEQNGDTITEKQNALRMLLGDTDSVDHQSKNKIPRASRNESRNAYSPEQLASAKATLSVGRDIECLHPVNTRDQLDIKVCAVSINSLVQHITEFSVLTPESFRATAKTKTEPQPDAGEDTESTPEAGEET